MSNDKHLELPPKKKSVLTRSSDYRDHCKDGFVEVAGFWEAHHILCNHSLAARENIKAEHMAYVEKCLDITDWNLNDSRNLIGLPKNRQYRESNGTLPKNLCSHQVDHNTSDGYTTECTEWLETNVWKTLTDQQVKHDLRAEDLKGLLEDGTDHFKFLLAERGAREDGTRHCWERRFVTNPEHKPHWYYPFSMSSKPRPRHAGSGSLTNFWLNLFKQIK